ncbi:MAG: DNA mismatch repair endonuclease MutL [Nitrospirota bacterium]|nr:DNA mismatch repair endonuclease MutL [Nitrospirota bacterium]
MVTEQTGGKIQVLPESVSSRIAAGEVIERPASVVKELIDNSLDAGSTVITIEARDGGKRLIRVTDDGEGMARADAQLACQRFATSKVRTEQDLLGITTYGFRGEALPSIASVSKLGLLTTRREDQVGTYLVVSGGEVSSVESRATAPGTQVEVNDLFFNTPGRQKFLKSATTEFSHICHVVQQAALARHGTHFRLTHNDHPVLDYPAVMTKTDRILQLYGARFMDRVLQVLGDQPGLRVEGVTVNPYHTRTSRTPQDIFVNNRPVKNSTISHAVYEAYTSFLPKGRHPVFTLFLEVDPVQVDVNVHPAKREVKFSTPERIHGVVKEAIRRPLQKKVVESHPWPTSADESLSSKGSVSHGGLETTVQPREDLLGPRGWQEKRSGASFGSPVQSQFYPGKPNKVVAPSEMSRETTPLYCIEDGHAITVLGQVNRTFLIAQIGAELHVVDQHTVHERVLFERLWRGWLEKSIPAQALLIPEPIELQPHAAVVLQEQLSELGKLGLEIEPFGSRSFVVRSIPSILGQMDYGVLVQDLIDDLSEWKSLDSIEKRIHPVLASMACRGAVQAGRAMSDLEIKQILDDWVQEGFPMTCPHGRRVAMRFSADELNRIFGRA